MGLLATTAAQTGGYEQLLHVRRFHRLCPACLSADGVSEKLKEVRADSHTTWPSLPPLWPPEVLARSLSGCQPPFAMLLNLSAISACWVQV
jgi:hypothetical protein